MNFLKRGLLSITRRKGKSLILLAVLFILGNVIAGAISISQATANVEESIKDKLGTAATVELDYEELESMDESEMMNFEIQNLDEELINQIGELPYVKYYDYNTTTYLASEEIDSYNGMEEEDGEYIEQGMGMEFQLKGVNYAPVLDIEEGKSNLVEGRVFTEEEIENGTPVAIISKKLAEKNNIQVGDTLSLMNQIYEFSESGEEEITDSRDVPLEVVGIFEPQTVNTDSENQEQADFMDMELQNTIYVANEIVSQEIKYSVGDQAEYEDYFIPAFVLNKPEDAEAFEEEVTPLLPELFIVRHATDSYESIAAPIESMSTLSKYVLIVSIITTILIIGLVVLLFLRDRKHELGIYLSLGESRIRVIGQIVTEVLIVSIIGMTLSLFTGNLLAQTVSDSMIDNDNNNQREEQMYYSEMQTDLTTDDVLEAYEVNLTGEFILLFYAVGIITILLSTLIPLIYIIRLNPKKIMM
ncbi:putative ABC transport system permease protein [Gracilibacillus orientalis]|uniref:Putative ABC transport system permease protein n=1 Tax=Gracilibacillus orientalis TaxID=334253 RepID=A0A1I4H935_9BACI|nr:ABC transporter permease [Gracilibacillus orientalis]SFL38270.1 putative ABC transport system permease protein [Gracilibacillus orientalis]